MLIFIIFQRILVNENFSHGTAIYLRFFFLVTRSAVTLRVITVIAKDVCDVALYLGKITFDSLGNKSRNA